ncbi:uncharacterized protein LOC131597103 [Vicia villosa]|uniref:uncharacterized protein LOC131597103 n=1 Tax=Vicia villosa TaxID=3911 RepID=UPI00273CE13C|nr:uncharacterized protein LOC131597103 [Vicia villosa]
MASRSAISISNSHSLTNKPKSHTCLCSPTTHPGSFRCSMHKNKPQRSLPNSPFKSNRRNESSSSSSLSSSPSMVVKANSLKTFLLQVIKPSSLDVHRRKNFQPKPTRFCLMNTNTNVVAVS